MCNKERSIIPLCNKRNPIAKLYQGAKCKKKEKKQNIYGFPISANGWVGWSNSSIVFKKTNDEPFIVWKSISDKVCKCDFVRKN